MRGGKRFASSEYVEDTNDKVLNNKRIFAGSLFDVHRAEPSQQKSLAAPVLDVQRAELSRHHVRALNTQFASWVQTQLINHPDELWEDGVRDYVVHASKIMDEFRDIVSWLKANVAKAGTLTSSESLTSGEKLVAETTSKETTLVKEKSGYTPVSSNASFTASWSSGVFSSSQSSGPSSNSCSAGSFSNSQSFGLFSNNQSSGGFSNSQSSGLLSNGQISGGFSNTQSTGLFSNSQSSGLFSNNQGLSSSNNNQSSAASSSTQSSGLFSFNQSSGVFSNSGSSAALFNSQTPVLFGSTSSVPINTNASDDGEDENDLQRPSSPSVKKSEEKGIVVVHEVKCKLYVKSSDPRDKDTWKDKGTGQLSIKCKEEVSKGTKESNPTVVVRNDVGKLLLNALLYSGIKTKLQKNSLVAIFHTLDDNGGNDSVVARTFLIRTKTAEEINKLATAIQEYAPSF